MFELLERLRTHSRLGRVINTVGYAHLAMWNHGFAHLPNYALRHAIVRRLYGLRLGHSNLHRGILLLSPWQIEVGDNVNIQMNCVLDGRGGLRIGNNVDLTPGVRILTEEHDIDSPDYATVKKPVVIEDDVVIGSWALILPGVTVGRGAVVGAGSVVTRDIPPYVLAAGNPATVKRERSRDLRYRLDYRRPWH